MGIEIQTYIPTHYSPEDVRDFLEAYGATEAKIEAVDFTTGYHIINFKWGGENRSMSFHSYNVNSCPFNGNLITLNAHGEAENIIRGIAKAFGGLFNPNDCQENWQMFSGYGSRSNGIGFMVKWGIVNGFIKNDSDFDGLLKAKEKWEERYYS